jgi:hypothetical protein
MIEKDGEMTTSYADFTYYTGTYLGNTISETAFPRLALRASAVINQLSFNRAVDDTDNEDAIKMACCAIAEEIQKFESDGSTDAISSESVGGYSVSYGTNSIKQMTNNDKYLEAASLYLGNTGLLFSGFADGEYGTDREDAIL